jgi:cell division septation protein DedD
MKSATIGSALIAGLLFLAGWASPSMGETYSIQVAADTDKGSAEERAEEMNRLGYRSYVRLETVPGKGDWYRVYVERFGSKSEADREAVSLKSLGLLNECFVRAVKEDFAPAPAPKNTDIMPTPPRKKTEVGPLRKKEDVAPPAPQKKGVAIPAPHKEWKSASSRLHFLHVGSFKERENAAKSVASFGKMGQKAFFVEEGVARDRWFKVYIGEFAEVKDAKKAGADLKERGAVSYFKIIGFDRGGNPKTANLHAANRASR